jgi:hypothetical protein
MSEAIIVVRATGKSERAIVREEGHLLSAGIDPEKL